MHRIWASESEKGAMHLVTIRFLHESLGAYVVRGANKSLRHRIFVFKHSRHAESAKLERSITCEEDCDVGIG